MKQIPEKSCIDTLSLQLTLEKEELESIYDTVVDPFYSMIQNDNNVKAFIDVQKLPGLKIKQTLFIFRFLTGDIHTLRPSISRLNHSHKELEIGAETLTPYFFVWSSLVDGWLKKQRGMEASQRKLWQEKIYILFGTIMHQYTTLPEQPADMQTPQKPLSKPRPTLADKVQEVHVAQVKQRISAPEFLSGMEYDKDLIDELEELEQDATASLFNNETIDTAHMREVIAIFEKYAHLLENTYEFKELAFALKSLNTLLDKNEASILQSTSLGKTLLFLNGILADIGSWRNAVFVKQEAIDVHYLDASLFSSIAQLEILLAGEENLTQEDDLNDLELF